jgi:hypothetical protein
MSTSANYVPRRAAVVTSRDGAPDDVAVDLDVLEQTYASQLLTATPQCIDLGRGGETSCLQ